MGSLSMITPVCSKSPPNQAGDIYYSTLFSFVKRFSEDFSIFLRPSPNAAFPRIHRFFIAFEENTGSKSNRYHIKYTRNPNLSSPNQKKYLKKVRQPPNPCALITHTRKGYLFFCRDEEE